MPVWKLMCMEQKYFRSWEGLRSEEQVGKQQDDRELVCKEVKGLSSPKSTNTAKEPWRLSYSEVGTDMHQEDLETSSNLASKSKLLMSDDSLPRTRPAPGKQPQRMLQQGTVLHQQVLSHPNHPHTLMWLKSKATFNFVSLNHCIPFGQLQGKKDMSKPRNGCYNSKLLCKMLSRCI